MLIVNFEICKTKNESTRIPSARVSQDPKPNVQQAHPGGNLIVPAQLGVKTTDVAFSLRVFRTESQNLYSVRYRLGFVSKNIQVNKTNAVKRYQSIARWRTLSIIRGQIKRGPRWSPLGNYSPSFPCGPDSPLRVKRARTCRYRGQIITEPCIHTDGADNTMYSTSW